MGNNKVSWLFWPHKFIFDSGYDYSFTHTHTHTCISRCFFVHN